jgi:cytochrome c
MMRALRGAAALALFMAIAAAGAGSPGETRSVWDGVYSAEQSKRGEPLYKKECGACHGDLMSGGEMAPPLAGGEFLSNWNGLTVGDLFERIRKTMPTHKPNSLTRKVYTDITAHMLAANNFPPGDGELPENTERMRQIVIEMTKPEKEKRK